MCVGRYGNQQQYFPDEVFREFVSNYDVNKDGILQDMETLRCNNKLSLLLREQKIFFTYFSGKITHSEITIEMRRQFCAKS